MDNNLLHAVSRNRPPFRADHVGSLLRPEAIKEARAKFQQGKILREELRTLEDAEIKKLVEKQKEIGLKAVTDGELRRSWWHLDFLWGLDGVRKIAADHGSIAFHGKDTRAETIEIEGKVDFAEHPFLEDFRYMKFIAGDGW